MSFCDLPQELVDGILEQLRDDSESLKAFSLVCRSFNSSSCRIMFSTITLFSPSINAISNPCQRFYHVIEENPDVALLVQDLRLEEEGISCSEVYVPWVNAERTLPLVLKKLERLRRLELRGDFDWPSLDISLRASLRAVLQLPTLTTVALTLLEIAGSSALTSMFDNCPNLQHVTLCHLRMEIVEDMPESEYTFHRGEQSLATKLQSLCLLLDDDMLSPFVSPLWAPSPPFNVSNLQRLTVGALDDRGIASLQRVMGMTAQTLRHLTLGMLRFSMSPVPSC